jgi:hypothetical protein
MHKPYKIEPSIISNIIYEFRGHFEKQNKPSTELQIEMLIHRRE